ncbi:hypothetical protein ACTXT7_011712 [Hymenolepis weldensis]
MFESLQVGMELFKFSLNKNNYKSSFLATLLYLQNGVIRFNVFAESTQSGPQLLQTSTQTRSPVDGFRSLWREPNRREIPQSSYSTPQKVPWQDNNSSSYHERNDEWRTATEQIVPIQNLHISSNDQFHSSVYCDPSFSNLSQLESFQSPSSFNPSIQIEINHPVPPPRTAKLQLNEPGLENEHEDQMEDAEDQESRNRRRNVTRESTRHLKKWLNAHLSNPYPNKGMSITQVSTWFANARRRIKKENQITWNSGARSSPENSGLTSEVSVNPTMNFQPQNQQLSNNWELGGSVDHILELVPESSQLT